MRVLCSTAVGVSNLQLGRGNPSQPMVTGSIRQVTLPSATKVAKRMPLSVILLDRLDKVGMRADHETRAGIDGRARHLSLPI